MELGNAHCGTCFSIDRSSPFPFPSLVVLDRSILNRTHLTPLEMGALCCCCKETHQRLDEDAKSEDRQENVVLLS